MLYLFVNWATSVSNDVTCYICSLIYMLSTQSHCTTIIQQPYITSGKLLRNPKQAWWEQASREMLSAVGATQTESSQSLTELNETDMELDSQSLQWSWLSAETCGHFALSFLSAVCSARPSSLMKYINKKKGFLFHTATCVTLYFHSLGWRLQQCCRDANASHNQYWSSDNRPGIFNSTDLYCL